MESLEISTVKQASNVRAATLSRMIRSAADTQSTRAISVGTGEIAPSSNTALCEGGLIVHTAEEILSNPMGRIAACYPRESLMDLQNT